jgi:hypothetical protein
MMEPKNQHHIAVAGPPAAKGAPKVAGTEPRTPKMEIAYEMVDHLENSRLSSCRKCQRALKTKELLIIPAYSQFEPEGAHHHHHHELQAL